MTTTNNRCWTCFRPRRLCFCDALTRIDNQTAVLILQHRRERFHPFNTARIVQESLQRCELLVAYNHELAERFEHASLLPSVGLLYPSADATLLDELPPGEHPEQLVILDGTWHQAKTLFRDIPRLQTLPRYRLAPTSPGRYRIRREPNEHALSTLEATVAALCVIEPHTKGFDRLIETFDRMVGDQIDRQSVPHDSNVQPNSRDEPDSLSVQNEPETVAGFAAATPIRPSNWRRNERRRRGSANVPRVLTGDLSRIVVAYGERVPGRAFPIYWTAIRLETGERFAHAIRSDALRDEGLLKFLHLSTETIRSAVSVDEFRELWRAFVRPSDRLAIQHFGTSRLLESVDAAFSPVTILKSINVPQEALISEEDLIGTGMSRASIRLQTAIDYVRQLHSLYRETEGASV